MMTEQQMWDNEEPISDLGIDVPAWIDNSDNGKTRCHISPNDVAAIVQGGCDSGAYMPAVTYYDARMTMEKHGDDVLDYIRDLGCGLPQPDDSTSWSGMAVLYLSCAVELWAGSAYSQLEDTTLEANG